jgi:hypothetical protein
MPYTRLVMTTLPKISPLVLKRRGGVKLATVGY